MPDRSEILDSLFVFLQGHPEYEAGTLLREYRRDIGRYLRGEWERYPSMPEGYFNGEASALLGAFRERALGERRQELIADFPMRALEGRLSCRWQHSAVGFYERWLDYLKERKAERRTPAVPLQPAVRRDWPGRALRPAADGSSAG